MHYWNMKKVKQVKRFRKSLIFHQTLFFNLEKDKMFDSFRRVIRIIMPFCFISPLRLTTLQYMIILQLFL